MLDEDDRDRVIRADTNDRPQSEPPAKAEQSPSQRPPANSKHTQSFFRDHRVAIILGAIALIAALIAGTFWWLNARNYESTDDAFVDARTVSISSQVAGAIIRVAVTDNQLVEKGAPLVSIDARDYTAKLEQAKAQVDQAIANKANIAAQLDAQQASIDQAQKNVSQAAAALTFSREENDRAQQLVTNGAGTQQNAQRTASDLRQKQAGLESLQAALIIAQKQMAVLNAQLQSADAQIESARATRSQAEADLSRTEIRAPEAGRVTKLSAAVGGYANVGQALMILVPRTVWVTANFKETQLALMRPGQPVSIRVDAYPGRTLHGRVDSIQAGSGTAFSLLPAENATGNYVKVVQRVPVKIVLQLPPDILLGPGMSVVPTVKVR